MVGMVVLDWGALATLFPADQLKGLRPLASPARACPKAHALDQRAGWRRAHAD